MLDLPIPYSSLDVYTEDLCTFVVSPLVQQITGGIHVNDALIYEAWESLPGEWTAWWDSWPDHRLAQRDLIDSIDEEAFLSCQDAPSKLRESRPASLTQWLEKMRTLTIPRKQRVGRTIDLPDGLKARMNSKKISEIARAVAYIQGICESRGITRIVDMGSGQGYLSVSLAHLYPDLQVLAIDGSETQIKGSQSFAQSLHIPEARLKHVHAWIDGSPNLAATIEDWARAQKCILVGLHACGNLSEYMIRYFTNTPCIDALAVVGCCYNHIVPRSSAHRDGFPISEQLRSRDLVLSPTALMTGCQAPSNWRRTDIQAGDRDSSVFAKRRLYRAILEKVFFDNNIRVDDSNRRPVWGIRKGDMISFSAFASRAISCLSIDAEKVSAAQLSSYEERFRDHEGRIAILWTLSVLCSKVVESVIALDRYWYLIEQRACGADVVPIFDFKQSPRNLMIVAEKDS